MLAFLISLLMSFSARANVVGADTQNFNPTTSGLDFVTVHSSETLRPGIFNLGVFVNYAVNSLPNYEDVNTSSRTNFSDSLLSADLNFGLGLAKNWDVGMSVPYLLSQSVDSDVSAFRGEYAEGGMTEIRVNTKFRFWGDPDRGVGFVVSANFNQIQDNPFAGQNPGPTLNFELVGDTTIDQWALGANVGFRRRDPGTQLVGVPVEPLKDQYIGSLAASYLLSDLDLKFITELFGGYPVEDSNFASDRDLASLEFLAGVKWDVRSDLAVHAGAGTEVIHGTSSPDWRVYTGLNWNLGPLFSRPKQVIVRKQSPIHEEEDPYAGTPQKQEAFVARDILFKFDSDDIEPEFAEALKRFVEYAQRPPGFRNLVVEGHTDSVGAAEYNQTLSLRRARSVRKIILNFGLPADKVSAKGYGERRPIADNGNFQGRALNRRVEFQINR